ncbi:MAG: putative phosphatase [Pedosphaera sp.]|nr:putative phosphatase [Pedosphaera sp.]
MTAPKPKSDHELAQQIESRAPIQPRPQISDIVFDFDGTLSWLRHGWPEMMHALMNSHLPPLPGESLQDRESVLWEIILGLNGKPTIVQMMRFAEVVSARGGPRLDGGELCAKYQHRLDVEIAARSAMIRRGDAAPDDFVVFGARPLLEKLRSLDLKLIILSSTKEDRVREEANLLGLAPFFGRHIYGSGSDPAGFSKMDVLKKLLHEETFAGENLLSFGDGPVEISCTKELGGFAIAVCSDENHNGSGIMDPFKRSQLLAAGADFAIPDYRQAGPLLDQLLGRQSKSL